jgi:hypothetical protein
VWNKSTTETPRRYWNEYQVAPHHAPCTRASYGRSNASPPEMWVMQYKFGFGYMSDSRHSKPHTHVATHIMPKFKERTLVTDPQKAFHFTDLQRLKPTRANDPYEYQAGWGNRHMSEVIPGTLPVAQNNPQEVRFGLYTEGITYSAFAAPRHSNFSTYMYRCRPTAAHRMPFPYQSSIVS